MWALEGHHGEVRRRARVILMGRASQLMLNESRLLVRRGQTRLER